MADSACSATAYLTGVKGNIKTIGVTADVAYKDWEAMINSSYHTTSIAQWAQEAGKGTGFVTTCTVVDASPVGLYGHTASRWVISGLTFILHSAPHPMGRNKRASTVLVVVRSSLGVELVTSYSESNSTVPW